MRQPTRCIDGDRGLVHVSGPALTDEVGVDATRVHPSRTAPVAWNAA